MQHKGIIGDRFELEALAWSSASSMIYRAREITTGAPVAVKVVRTGELEGRFTREVKILAETVHPAIVRYIAHGAIPGGDLFLAMEWLEGEDLARRLRRAELSVSETLTLATRVAAALAAAHAGGIVHRDIKPANIFLPGGDVAEVKLLDFGIASLRGTERELTLDGTMVGTPGYMAPEQARGLKTIDARADVFALGCVLYRCLAGVAPFSGDDLLAVLAKLIFEEPARLAELRPELAGPLDELVARMMSKTASQRPGDGAEVLEALAAIPVPGGDRADLADAGDGVVEILDAESIPPAPAITDAEQRLRSVVVTAAPAAEEETLGIHARLREVVRPLGAEIEPVAGGALVATLSASGEPTDQAAQAARCALAMRAALPRREMVLATGRHLTSGRAPLGEVIDRAAHLLRRAVEANDAGKAAPPLRLDESTAGLLRNHFEIGGDATSLFILREREPLEPTTRTLLGKPTPCVGRERELDLLEATYRRCVEGPSAQAVLVVSPAGIGKSRLRYELLRRLEAHATPPEIWVGRGDPIAVGSPFRMLGQAVRQGIGLGESEPLVVRQRKLRARLSLHLGPTELEHTALFLGELLGIPFSSEDRAELRAARQDPMHMSDRMRSAWEDFIAAETAHHPVLIVLDDLHWGDLPTVEWIGSAIRNLHNRPLMVIGLGRPEVEEMFPRLWADVDRLDLRLQPLTAEASSELVRHVFGEKIRTEVLSNLCERAAGNAFYLEEMIRAVAEGRGSALPETVLAMVESRLARLGPDARRALRAASVFGQVFWKGGIEALLGIDAESGGSAREQIAELTAEEVISPRREARFHDQQELIFRHSLVQGAAYATLTEEDRALGHRLAAGWLLTVGETDAVVLGEHFERGGEPMQAVSWYLRAAEQALEGNDFAAAVARAQRGIACGASGETCGALYLVQAEAHRWSGNNAAGMARATAAMEHLPRGGERWLSAAAALATMSAKIGNREQLIAVAKDIGASDTCLPPEPYIIAAARVATQLLHAGHIEAADALLGIAQAVAIRSASSDAAAMACIYQCRALRAFYDSDSASFMALMQSAADNFDRAGDLRSAAMQRTNVAYAYIEFGAYASAAESLREVLAAVTRMGMKDLAAGVRHNLGIALARLGELEEARAVETLAVRASVAHGNRRLECASRVYLSTILLLAEDFEGAEREARAAVELLAAAAPMRAHALGTLARALLAQGQAAPALTAAEEAMALLESSSAIEEDESLVRVAYIEALLANGRKDEVPAAVALAHGRLLARAASISEAAWRDSFLKVVPDHARILEMVRAWVPDRISVPP